jgi:hypothetical protein
MARARRFARTSVPAFDAITVEGALIAPAMLARIAERNAGGQSEVDYGVLKGLALRDEIARYFRIGQALFAELSPDATSTPGATVGFVEALLRDVFGFTDLLRVGTRTLEDRTYAVTLEGLGGRVPVVIVPPLDRLDAPSTHLPTDGRRYSATSALQDWLNANDGALWGLCANGLQLRLMRDNDSLTRPAFIQADLRAIFENEAFADFAVLWLLIHATRFGEPGETPGGCKLENWREAGAKEGLTARERLRDGVEAALLSLGGGFVGHPDNAALRDRLTSGALPLPDFFGQLLRLVYRLIFLFAAEDRNLLHPPSASVAARKLYAQGYSVGNLRDHAIRRAAWDRHRDRWEGLLIVFTALARGEARLGLPALGGLFARGAVPDLANARLANRDLMEAIYRLAWLKEPSGLVPVNWRDMETEELGSVYESLLELTPRLVDEGRGFGFTEGDETLGNARKISGSYYTPDALVRLLLDSTLDPVLDAAEARNRDDPAAEILKLSIIDPACGSGHFLLGAARRAAGRIAGHRSGGAPTQAAFQHALREVVSHCIYGVDRNPMAVELCKVALWIEALEPGKPLTFLDSRIRCGDSLIGAFDYEMLKQGIPDEAFKPLAGDDKEVARAYAKFNKEQREGKGATGFLVDLKPPTALTDAARAVIEMPEDTLDEISAKRTAFERLHSGAAWIDLKIACDCYVAAFFTPKTGDAPDPAALAKPAMPLTDHVWAAARGQPVYGPLVARADKIANDIRAFHWPIEFPQIFARGGFDAVIGNPPWEVSQLGEQEYFAARSPDIAAMSGDARKKAIARLETEHPRLWEEFVVDKRAFEASNGYFRASGRFDLTAVGKINSYALFAEHFERLTNAQGRAGVMVPTGIATDTTTSAFFCNLMDRSRLTLIYSFYEIRGWFKDTDDRKSFCVLGIGSTNGAAEFCFDIRQIDELDNPERRFTLTAEKIARINPNTKTAPVFRSRADAELTAKLYAQAPVLIEEHSDDQGGDVNPWGITFQQGLFNMTSASKHFRTEPQLIDEGWARDGTDWVREADTGLKRRMPLYEAKMIHHYDHRWATYAGGSVDDDEDTRDCTLVEKQDPCFEPSPRYWVPEGEVKLRAARVPSSLKRGLREENAERILKSLTEWLTGYFPAGEGRAMGEADLFRILGRGHAWRSVLGASPDVFLLTPKTVKNGAETQCKTPLSEEDVAFLTDGPDAPLTLAAALIDHKQPRWLMGWRDIALRSVERTAIASVFPKVGVGHTMPLFYLDADAKLAAVCVAMWGSLAFDFIARLSIGGTHLTYSYLKQFAALPPSAFTTTDLAFITPRVLELTYTSHALRPWAEDLGHTGPPFAWDETRRAELRAELDAFFASKYGLTRDELRYVLDPADARGAGYPSETFRVLKNKEEARFGEYRTGRLVLAAWDAQALGPHGAGAAR